MFRVSEPSSTNVSGQTVLSSSPLSTIRPALYQDLDVTQYRGQILTYRAFVRVDPAQKGVARLLVRLHRKDCSTTFRDDMGNHPVVSGDWAAYEIRAPGGLGLGARPSTYKL